MARLIIIDPEELEATGHHRSVDREIVQACKEIGVESVLLDRSKFRLRTYLSDEEIELWLNNTDALDEDYDRLDIQPGDKLLIHTASPWHLSALSRIVRSIPNVSLAVGLIYPLGIWTGNPLLIDQLSGHLDMLIRTMSKDGVFFYSETGYLELKERRVELPVLVLPISKRTVSQILSLKEARRAPGLDVVRFGFFGQPREEKGFREILELVANVNYETKEFRFYLPTGYQSDADQINSMGASSDVRAETGVFDHEQYFETMETCDAILCYYNPKYYGSQMSGIVTDAPLLGKATLITHGTEPGEFLRRYCGGSYCPVNFTSQSLHEAFSMHNSDWKQLKQRAEASEKLLLEMKSAVRFLKIACGIDNTHHENQVT